MHVYTAELYGLQPPPPTHTHAHTHTHTHTILRHTYHTHTDTHRDTQTHRHRHTDTQTHTHARTHKIVLVLRVILSYCLYVFRFHVRQTSTSTQETVSALGRISVRMIGLEILSSYHLLFRLIVLLQIVSRGTQDVFTSSFKMEKLAAVEGSLLKSVTSSHENTDFLRR